MNIFILDKNPNIAASYHCDKHVVKMILESGQMLCTAHWVLWLNHFGKTLKDFRIQKDAKEYLRDHIPKKQQPPWSMTHVNHPCSIWTRENLSNYKWHLNLMNSLLGEYTMRYDKIHKAEAVFTWLSQNLPPGIPELAQTPFPICMKDEYKISADPVECYREYYIKDKVRFARWKMNNEPAWWKKRLTSNQSKVY
jgi:hypothetical protein